MMSPRRRIALQIRLVVVSYDRWVRNDAALATAYRRRARRLLDGLDAAARAFPDLNASLTAARAELEL